MLLEHRLGTKFIQHLPEYCEAYYYSALHLYAASDKSGILYFD